MTTTTQPSINEKIVKTAWHCLKAQNLPKRSGWCMMTTRMIVERALGLGSMGFYSTYLVGHPKAAPNVPRNWWARDAQKILRDTHRFGVKLEDRMAGDLVFNHAVAPSKDFRGHMIGHVGILIDRDTVLENSGARRGVRIYSAIRLTPLREWLPVHQVIRLGPPLRYAEGSKEVV